MPFYKGTHIKFDVVPNRLDVKVGHESILLPVSDTESSNLVSVIFKYVWELCDINFNFLRGKSFFFSTAFKKHTHCFCILLAKLIITSITRSAQ